MQKFMFLVCCVMGLSLGACLDGPVDQAEPASDRGGDDDDADDDDGDDGVCDPGASRGCACSDGRSGAQECRADRTGFTNCSCTGTIPGADDDEPEPAAEPEPDDDPEPESAPPADECGKNVDCPGQCTPRTAGGPKECLPCTGDHQCRTSGRDGWVCDDGVCEAPSDEPEPAAEPEPEPDDEPEANPEPDAPECTTRTDCTGGQICNSDGNCDDCSLNSQCPSGQECNDSGRCAVPPPPPSGCVPSTVRNCLSGDGQQTCSDNGVWVGACPEPPTASDFGTLSISCELPSSPDPVAVKYLTWYTDGSPSPHPDSTPCTWGSSIQEPTLTYGTFECNIPNVAVGEDITLQTDFEYPEGTSLPNGNSEIWVARELTGGDVPAECAAKPTEDARHECAFIMDWGTCEVRMPGTTSWVEITKSHLKRQPPNLNSAECDKDENGAVIPSTCPIPFGPRIVIPG